MEVLVVAEQLRRAVPGGIGTYLRGLLQGIQSIESPPRVTLHASRAAQGSDDDALAAFNFPLVTSRLPGPFLTRAWDRSLRDVPSGFDVVHAPSLAAPPSKSVPLAVTVHDLSFRDAPDTFPARGRRWHEAALARALRRARVFVVPSRATADALTRVGAQHDRVEVIEEGCDHLPGADTEGADALLDRLGVREGFVLTVSTLEPRKNLARLLEAYSLARSALPEPWNLVVVGPSGWGPSLHSVPHGVVVAGEVSEAVKTALYRKARCLVYVPLVEGFGLPPVEAMHECTPVVASDVPSTGAAALRVDPLDPRSIADGIVTAAGDDRARAELVTAGLLRAGELTWHAAATRHVELWRSIA